MIKLVKIKNILSLLLFLAVIAVLAIIAPGFIQFHNLMSVLITSAFIALPAMGLAAIMLSGSFDLSFAGLIGLSAIITLTMVNNGSPVFVALAVAFFVVLLFELLNSFFIVNMGIHPWLTTIATMLTTMGLERAISKGHFASTQAPFFLAIRYGAFLSIPLILWLLAVVFLLLTLLFHNTPFSKHAYAVGGNLPAALKVGIKTKRVKYAAFLLMGVLCWLTAITYISQLSGYPPTAAYISLLDVILSVYIGMSVSKKGIISIPGALFGAVFVALLANGLGLAGVSAYWIKLAEGFLVILVILGNSLGSDEIVQLD